MAAFPEEMKLELDKAALFLLVEAKPDETPEEVFSMLAAHYDPRSDDPDFGPLYQIGPKYVVNGRSFFQIQTYAGSLGARMMIAVRKGEFPRAVAIKLADGKTEGFDLVEPSGITSRIQSPLIA